MIFLNFGDLIRWFWMGFEGLFGSSPQKPSQTEKTAVKLEMNYSGKKKFLWIRVLKEQLNGLKIIFSCYPMKQNNISTNHKRQEWELRLTY